MSKHILVLGGIWNTDYLVKNNYQGKITNIMTNDQLSGGLEDKYDRVISLPKKAPKSEWITLAKAIHEIEKIDMIGNYGFYFQEIAVSISEELGIPTTNPRLPVECAEDKFKMRETLRAKGLDTVQSARIQTESELTKFAENNHFPIIIKPVDGAASRGIYKITNQEELVLSFKRFRDEYPDAEILVEQFIQGPEFSVETFSENGEHRIISITEKFKEPVSFVELGHLVPARIPPTSSEEEIHKVILDFLNGIELQNGPSHTEFILSPQGPKIIETQLRLGGDMIPRLLQLSTGIDFWDMTARQALGQKVFDLFNAKPERKQHASILYFLPTKPSTLSGFSDISDLYSTPGIDRIDLLKSPGYQFDGILESSKRPVSVIGTGNTAEEAIETVYTTLSKIDILTNPAQDKSSFQPDNINIVMNNNKEFY